MPDILTITLNPAVDFATSVETMAAGQKLYCKPPRVDPGGGGVNVARTICKLGGQTTALVAVGGAMGARLIDLLAREKVSIHPVTVGGETRHSFAVTEDATGAQYRFSLPGEEMTGRAASDLLSEIAAAAPKGGCVVLSGGVAPGLSDDFPKMIQRIIAPSTDRLIVDTSKAPLAGLIASPSAPLLLLRVDQREAAIAAAHSMESLSDCLTFASRLIARGVARMIVIGRGAEGSLLVGQDGRFFCHAVQVPVLSTIGAGDAFVGAMTQAINRGDRPELALRWGVAAACATVATEGTALCNRASTEALYQGCTVEEV